MYNPDRRNAPRQSSQHRQSTRREDDYLKEEAVLPRNGRMYAIIIGIVGAIIVYFVPIAIPLLNASLFNQGSHLDQSLIQVANSIVGLGVCLTVFLYLLILLVAGVMVGIIAVKRELGFWAGLFLGAAIPLSYISSAFIPGYPGHISSNTVAMFSGLWWVGVVADIVLVAVCAYIGGRVCKLVTRITTSKHPYYYSPEQE